MKTTGKVIIVSLVLLFLVMGFVFSQGNTGCDNNRQGKGKGPGNGNKGRGNNTESGYNLDDYPAGDLSAAEEAGLRKMYEEEKLARDVYSALYEKWGLRIFSNISESEQTHIDAVERLLDRYGIHPGKDQSSRGEFEDPELAALYTELTEKGSGNLVKALTVGAMIEDLDIFDLKQLIADTDNQDIKIVYANLQKGSRNHLRSFYARLTQYNSTYTANYISPEFLEKIIATDKERGAITDPDYLF
jgi:hypothetical protein